MQSDHQQAALDRAAESAPRARDGVGVLYASVSALGFGFLGVLGSIGHTHGLSSSTLLSWRFILATLLLGGIYWYQHGIPTFRIKPFLLGSAGYAAQSLLFFETVEQIGPGKAALLLYTYPAIVMLLGWLVHRQRPGQVQFIVLIVTTAGCLMVLYSPTGHFSLTGIILGLVTALVYSLYLLMSEQILKGLDPATSSFNVCLGTGLSLTIYALAGAHGFVPTTAVQWSVILGIVILCTVIPTVALFVAIQQIGSAKAALCSTLEPAMATFLGALILGEQFSPQQLVGGAMIVSSIAIIYIFRKHDSNRLVSSNKEIKV